MTDNELDLVIGTGPLGMAVMRELLSRGMRVRLMNRSGHAHVPEGVEVVKGDITASAGAREVCQGATVVYHCANAPYTEWPQRLSPIMDGIIQGAGAIGAKLVYGDNLYMYGPVSGQIREDLPYAATGRKGHVRAQIASTLMEAHKSGKVRATIGRASDFFGPGVVVSAVGEKVFAPALAGKAANILGDPDLPHTYTFIDDFAKGLVTLGQHEKALGQGWHVPSAETLPTRQFIELIFEEVGKTPKIRTAPSWLVSLLALFSPMMRELKEMLYEFEEPFIVDHSKYERAFGSDTTPHREAIRQTLEWFRENPR